MPNLTSWPLGESVRRHGMDPRLTLPPKGGTTNRFSEKKNEGRKKLGRPVYHTADRHQPRIASIERAEETKSSVAILNRRFRLARLRARSGWLSLFAALSNQSRQCRSTQDCLDVWRRLCGHQSRVRKEGRVRSDADSGRRSALPDNSLQPRDRARSGDGGRAMDIRSASEGRPWLFRGDFARRRGLAWAR